MSAIVGCVTQVATSKWVRTALKSTHPSMGNRFGKAKAEQIVFGHGNRNVHSIRSRRGSRRGPPNSGFYDWSFMPCMKARVWLNLPERL